MSGFSWVTLATNDSYSLGALVLAHSLKRVGTAHQLVVMVTPGVTQPMREKLRNVFDLVFEVNILDSKDERNLLLLQRPELGITFTKLHCWRLTQYKKCVFLDADTLVLQNCDELFERDEFSAAPDVGWPDCFNSGVFVYVPSDETFQSLLTFALERGSFDGGDQGLLNLYFSDWAHKDISKHLPFIYNMCSTACYSYLPAFKQFGENVKIVHFIGNSKPWLQYFNSENLQVSCTPGFEHLQLVFEHWWNLFCSHVHSALQPTMARINTTIASSCTSSSHTLTYYVNESKCEDSLCTEQFCGTDINNIPVWDPWENYQPVDTYLENKLTDIPVLNNLNKLTDIPVLNNLNKLTDIPVLNNLNNEPSTSSYYVEKVENKIESSFHESCNYSTQSNDITINVNVENVDCKSHLNVDSGHSSKQDEHVSHVSITNNPPPDSCTYNQPLPPDPSPSSAYQSVTSTVVCDAKSASTVTITTEQPATYASKTEPRTDSNGGLAGAFAQMTLREPRSASQGALEEHLRRQGWEAGRIDYLGQDSFDNVWKKICETMSAAPKKEPSPPKQIAAPAPVAAVPEPVPAPVAEPVAAPTPAPAVESVAAPVPAPVSEPVTAPAVEAVPAPATVAADSVPTPSTAPVAESVPAATPIPALEPVTAPVPTPVLAAESVATPVSAPESVPVPAAEPVATPVSAPAAEPVATPVPAPTAEPVATPVPTPAVEPVATSAPAPATESVAASAVAPAATESVATSASTVEPVSAPVPAPTVEPVIASAPTPAVEAAVEPVPAPAVEAAIAPVPAPDAGPIATSAPTSVADVAPVDAKAAAPIAELTPKAPKEAVKEVPSETKATEPVAAPAAVEPPKTETKAVEVQKTAEASAAKTEKVKPAEKSTTPVATEEKKEAAKAKPKAESAEGQSSESTPVPPPRKSGKNGGATAKKTTKKK